MTYTAGAVIAVALAAGLDLLVLRTRLLFNRAFWASYAIILVFQLAVNGILTGLDIVQYDPDRTVGLRVVFAPVEDIGFGFALVTATLTMWLWLERRAERAPRGPGRAVPPAADAAVPR